MTLESKRGIQTFKAITSILLKRLQDELVKQGHKATGKLLASIRVDLTNDGGSPSITGSFEDYGIFLDTGVRNVRPGRAYIEALTKWLRAIGVRGGNAQLVSIAFAIRAAHLKEGIPTRASKRFSRSRGQRRIGWMTEALNDAEASITREIDDTYLAEIEFTVDNFVTQSNKILR